MVDDLVLFEGNVAYTTTRIIADGCGIEHHAAMKLVKKYENDLNSLGSTSGFEIRKFKTAGRPGEEALLDEEQTTFLITLMRNSPKVVKFKKELTKAFFQQRRIISNLIMQRDNPNWQEARRDGKIIYRQKTDVIKNFVEYATSQGSGNAERYYSNFARMENSALFFFEQKYKNMREVLTIKQLMQIATADDVIEKALKEGMDKGMHYKDCYKLAKERVISFAEIIGKSPVLSIELTGRGI